MKVLYIYGDDDYAAITFQKKFGGMSLLEIWNRAKESDYDTWEFQDGCFVQALQYKKVDPEFIKFLNSIKDHDATKHNDWIAVE